jgi:hypothetical protein
MQVRGSAVGVVYVGAVSVLAASAFWTPDEPFTWDREAVAMLLTLPALLAGLPVIYLLGAAMWHITNATGGGPMWPVTLVYTLMFAGMATANVLIVRPTFAKWRVRHRERRAETAPRVR